MDWKMIIERLVAAGMSEAAIAAEAGLTQPSINRLRHGRIADPKHRAGEAILRLFSELPQSQSDCEQV